MQKIWGTSKVWAGETGANNTWQENRVAKGVPVKNSHALQCLKEFGMKTCRALYGLMLLFAVISSTSFIKLIAGALPDILLQEKNPQNNKQQPPLFWFLHATAWEQNASCWKTKGVTRGSRGSLEGNVISSINAQVARVWQAVISQGWFRVPKATPQLCASARSALEFGSKGAELDSEGCSVGSCVCSCASRLLRGSSNFGWCLNRCL